MAGRANKDGVNVQVILRCRPFSRSEQLQANRNFVLCKEDSKEVLVSQNVGGNKLLERSFHFDKVFSPESGQERLYTQAIAPIVEEVLEGFNCTIFAYGQTGTGKTYTMEGGDRDSQDGQNLSDVAGVIPRAIHHIFTTLDRNDSEYTVKCSFLELYNEETTDLLAVGERMDQKLRIMEDRSGVVIQGLEEFIVKSSTDIYALLDRGSAKRKVAETMLNKQSSRSHGVFCITVHMREIAADGEEVIKIGKLYLVDLAGSENVSRSGAAGTMAKEAGSINKSLLTLGRVITALVEGMGHIPYRDSKLTRLLRDSLGGKTKTCIIATIAPTAHCQDETLSTLDYAHRAKNIRNKPEVNQKISKTAHIKELNAEIDRLKAELFATREKNGIYVPPDQYEQKEESSKKNQFRIEELEAQMEALALSHQAEIQKQLANTQRLQQELSDTTNAYQMAKLGIQERDFLIATHRRSEAAVLAQSEQLTCELQQANRTIDDLHARLTDRAEREQQNASVVEEFCQASQQRCQHLQASCSQFSHSVQSQLQQANSAMTAVQEQQAQSGAKFKAQMQELQAHMRRISESGSESAQAVKDAIAQTTESLLQCSQNLSITTSAEAQAAEQRWKETLDGMQRTSDAYQAEALSALESQSQISSSLLALAKNGFAQAAQSMSESCEYASQHLSQAQAQLQDQQAAFTGFRTDFNLSMASEKVELMKQIEGLVSGFVQRSTQSVTEAACVSGAAQKAMVDNMGIAQQDLGRMLATAQTARQAQDVSAEETFRTGQAESGQARQRLTDSNAQTASEVAGLRGHLQQQKEQSLATVKQHVDSLSVLFQASSQAVQEQVQTAAASTSAGLQEAQEQCGRLQTVQDIHAATEQAHNTELAGLRNNTATTLKDYGDKHQMTVQSFSASMDQSLGQDFAQDPDAGVLPEKLGVNLPAADWIEAVKMPPADVILAEFHRQRDGLTAPPERQVLQERPVSASNLPEASERVECQRASQSMRTSLELGFDSKSVDGDENVDPNLDLKEAMSVGKLKSLSAKERSHSDIEMRMLEANRMKKRLKQ